MTGVQTCALPIYFYINIVVIENIITIVVIENIITIIMKRYIIVFKNNIANIANVANIAPG